MDGAAEGAKGGNLVGVELTIQTRTCPCSLRNATKQLKQVSRPRERSPPQKRVRLTREFEPSPFYSPNADTDCGPEFERSPINSRNPATNRATSRREEYEALPSPASPASSRSPSPLPATPKILQADTYNTIMEVIKDAKSSSSKWAVNRKYTVAKQLQAGGRFLPRMIGPFASVYRTLLVGLTVHGMDNPYRYAANIKEFKHYSSRQCRDYIDNFEGFLVQVPAFEKLLSGLEQDMSALEFIAAFLDSHARSACSDDISALRYDILNYIPDVKLPDGTEIRRFDVGDCNKTHRGFNDI
ncbi:hypothetical protein A0H81_05718 [Grifola frondosa]|uniref:Uncharacterized protein n=1 Tax=Grifola frondosa TaxID=5627 RepID=A0A1C7MD28_GRIFR|nr:hypothetical protein A0H81_05718 [Grifola frondosa]